MCCDYTQCHCGRNREEEGVYVRERERERKREGEKEEDDLARIPRRRMTFSGHVGNALVRLDVASVFVSPSSNFLADPARPYEPIGYHLLVTARQGNAPA